MQTDTVTTLIQCRKQVIVSCRAEHTAPYTIQGCRSPHPRVVTGLEDGSKGTLSLKHHLPGVGTRHTDPREEKREMCWSLLGESVPCNTPCISSSTGTTVLL